jgi:hypothetical protein
MINRLYKFGSVVGLFAVSDFIAFSASTLVFIVLLSRIKQEEYGLYAFSSSLSFWFISLINFAMNYNGVRILQDVSRRNWSQIYFIIVFKFILFLVVLAFLVILAIFKFISISVLIAVRLFKYFK